MAGRAADDLPLVVERVYDRMKVSDHDRHPSGELACRDYRLVRATPIGPVVTGLLRTATMLLLDFPKGRMEKIGPTLSCSSQPLIPFGATRVPSDNEVKRCGVDYRPD